MGLAHRLEEALPRCGTPKDFLRSPSSNISNLRSMDNILHDHNWQLTIRTLHLRSLASRGRGAAGTLLKLPLRDKNSSSFRGQCSRYLESRRFAMGADFHHCGFVNDLGSAAGSMTCDYSKMRPRKGSLSRALSGT